MENDVDLEAQICRREMLQLKDYKYFAERLALIKHAYDVKKPYTVKQWWFDRRNRAQWWTLMIAIVVFVFGLISAITGILQVVASFRSR